MRSGSSIGSRPRQPAGKLLVAAAALMFIASVAFGYALASTSDSLPATAASSAYSAADDSDSAGFTFAVAADPRQFAGPGDFDNPAHFRGVAEAIKARGGAAFVLSPGDIDPPAGVRWTLDRVLGTDSLWYPVVGNHEAETWQDMAWLRAYNPDPNEPDVPPYPGIVRWGPPGCVDTTYSFDYGNAHFAVLNEYCDSTGEAVTDGDISGHLYDWLADDLAATTQEHIFVAGHEPAFVQPDQDNDRVRHEGDSLDAYPDNRDRFWNLLKSHGVRAYIAGHTHNYSAVEVDGVWQIDSGHAKGRGDRGAPSTFVLVHVNGDSVSFDAYRETFNGGYDYDDIVHHGVLAGPG